MSLRKATTVSQTTVDDLMNCDELLSMKEALRIFPRGARVDLSSMHRFRTKGSGGVKLRAIRIGGRWFTSRDAIREFIFARSNA